jgi:hypothetical protein
MPYSGLFGLSGDPNQVGKLSPIGDAFLAPYMQQSQSNTYLPGSGAPSPMAGIGASTLSVGAGGQLPGYIPGPGAPLPSQQAPSPQALSQGLSSPPPAARIGPPAMQSPPSSMGSTPNDAVSSVADLMARYGGTFRGAAIPGGGGFRRPL